MIRRTKKQKVNKISNKWIYHSTILYNIMVNNPDLF